MVKLVKRLPCIVFCVNFQFGPICASPNFTGSKLQLLPAAVRGCGHNLAKNCVLVGALQVPEFSGVLVQNGPGSHHM